MKTRSDFLSASRIKTLEMCPMKFYLQYVAEERPKMPKSWGAANGTLLHEVFEEYARGERRDWRKNLMEKFRGLMSDTRELEDHVFKFSKGQKVSLSDQIKRAKRKCGKCPVATILSDGHSVFCQAMGKTTNEFVGTPYEMITDTIRLAEVIFDDDFNPIDDLKVLAVEHEFDITFPNGIRTYGFMDLLSEVDDKSIEIRDYKSAKRVPTDKEIMIGAVKEDIQMQLYFAVARYCCDNNIAPFKDTYENIYVTIHYLRKVPITMMFSTKDYKAIIERLEREKKKIEEIEKPRPLGMTGPNKFWICNYCNVEACEKACLEVHGKTREELANE